MTTPMSTTRRVLFATLIATLMIPTVPSIAALNAYLRLEGETQGPIEGGATQTGREGAIEVWAWEHEVVSPRDAATGLPTGKRQHKPVSVTKPIDKATPLLMRALVTNENIPVFTLRFYRPSRTGREVQFFTVQLMNARIAGIRQVQLDNKVPENAKRPVYEQVTFVYQKIVWTFEETGTSAEDSAQSVEAR